jgi:hypothetical protein
LTSSGVFYIGGGDAVANVLTVVGTNGNLLAAGDITAYSDPKLKDVTGNINNATDKLKQLNGVHFTWKDLPPVAVKAGKKDIGLLSTEVAAVFPEIVSNSVELDGGNYQTVAYDKLVAVLIESVKELSARIDLLERKSTNNRDM